VITVLSIAVVGVMLAYVVAVKNSADPVVTKQALAAAEALLDEVQLNSYNPLPGTAGGACPLRQNFDDVDDYNGYSTAGCPGLVRVDGTPIAGLGAYDASVTVALTGLNGVAEAKLITVTVTGPGGSVVASGYRINYP